MKIKVIRVSWTKSLVLGTIDGYIIVCHYIDFHPYRAVIRRVNKQLKDVTESCPDLYKRVENLLGY
jgi:hypothetical protein